MYLQCIYNVFTMYLQLQCIYNVFTMYLQCIYNYNVFTMYLQIMYKASLPERWEDLIMVASSIALHTTITVRGIMMYRDSITMY